LFFVGFVVVVSYSFGGGGGGFCVFFWGGGWWGGGGGREAVMRKVPRHVEIGVWRLRELGGSSRRSELMGGALRIV
jgi:hypothetical protein